MSGLKMLFFIVSGFHCNNIIKSNDRVYTHLVNLFTITTHANEGHEPKAKYSEYNRHPIFRAFLAEKNVHFTRVNMVFVIAWENKHLMFNLHQFQVS